MSQETNSNSEHSNQPDINAEFAAMMGSLASQDASFHESIQAIRPTVEQQRRRFDAVRAEHRAQWQEYGILAIVADRILKHPDGDRLLGNSQVLFQRHHERMNDGTSTEVWELTVDKTITTQTDKSLVVKANIARIPFATVKEGMHTPSPGFTAEQVAVVSHQVANLEAFRQNQMELPNLDWNLATIFDPSTAMMILPKDDQK